MTTTNAEFAGRHSTRFANIALCLALIGAAAMLGYHQGLFIPRALEVRDARGIDGGYAFGNDFYQIWLTSRQWLRDRTDPYSEQATRDIQIGLYGRTLDPGRSGDPKDQRRFPYPAFADLLFWPAARLPFPIARIVVLCVLICLTATSIWLWMKALRWSPRWQWTLIIFLLVMTSYPALEAFYAGQIGLVVAFLLPASILALQRGKPLLSGNLLALTLIKPQVTSLAIVYLFFWSLHDLRRRGRFLVAFIVTATLLIAAALLIWPHWIQSWIYLVIAYRGYNPPPLFNLLLASVGTPSSIALVLTAAALIAAVLLAWQKRSVAPDSLDFLTTLSLLLALTAVVVLAGQAVYDHIILLPGIFLAISRWQQFFSRWIQKTVGAMAATMLLWPWASSSALLAVRPLLTHQQFYSGKIFYLPIYMAAVFPFVVLAVLALAIHRRNNSLMNSQLT